MRFHILLVLAFAFVAFTAATTFFEEEFGNDWESRWVYSDADDANGNAGKFVPTAGKWYNDKTKDQGIQTNPDARFFKNSAKFTKFNNKGKTLVLQYSVKNEQDLDCGGGYIKLFPPGLDQETFNGESPYNIMFGPDKCGFNSRVHFIFNYKGTNHLIKKTVTPASDQLTHLYTAIIHPNNSYELRIDNEVKESGNLDEDWDFLPPKEINDPSVSKPSDWVDEQEIADPESKKPEGWDQIPAEVADPEAAKPEDWDTELDGEWEAPSIPNPDYKGEWKAPMIKNPAYKGEWSHPQIANPDYKQDSEIYAFDHEFVGFEIWQVKTGTIFDHILVTDSVAEAEAFANGYFKDQQAGEKKMFDQMEEERKQNEEEERKKLEAEAKEADVDEEEQEADDEEEHDKDEL